MKNKNQLCIACIMAHSDDLELCCGGVFAKYIARGYKGIYGVLSLCNSGYISINRQGQYEPSKKVYHFRHKEAEAAAKVFGAELFKMDLMENNFTDLQGNRIPLAYPQFGVNLEDAPDGGLPLCSASGAGENEKHSNKAIQIVADLLIKNQPDIIIGQTVDDSNPDHFCAALIVRKAYERASETVELGPFYIAHSNHSFLPIEPTWIADVTGYEHIAEKAIVCHESQGGSQRIHGMQECWQKWGKKINVKSAEPFFRVLK